MEKVVIRNYIRVFRGRKKILERKTNAWRSHRKWETPIKMYFTYSFKIFPNEKVEVGDIVWHQSIKNKYFCREDFRPKITQWKKIGRIESIKGFTAFTG